MNKLKQVREKLGCTQEQLAKEMGVTVRTVNAQEAKETPQGVYVMAAQYLALLDELRAIVRIAKTHDMEP